MRLPHQSRQKYTSTTTMLFQGKANTNQNNKQISKGTHPHDTIHLSTGEQYYIPINPQKVNTTFIPVPQLRSSRALSTASQTQGSTYVASVQVLAQQSCTASRSKTCHTCLNHMEMSSCACLSVS